MQVEFINEDNFIKYKFKTKPYKHQYDVFLKCKDKEAYALFMEQGTGKSKVIIDNIAYLYRKGKIDTAIIAAPKGVYRNWLSSEFKTHMPDDVKELTDICVWSPNETKSNVEMLINFLKPSHKLKFFIINIEALSTDKGKNYLHRLLNTSASFFCIDESTTIKHRTARRTKSVLKLGRLAKFRRILTGTPVTQGPLDLWSQINFLDEYILQNSFYAYRNTYCVMRRRRTSTHSFDEVVSYQRLDQLQNTLEPYSFRVTKDECLDLPAKVRLKREIELSKDQKAIYHTLRKRAILELEREKLVSAPLIITRILRLQQILCGFIKYDDGTEEVIPGPNPRLEELLNVLEETQGGVIIWATFVSSIKLIKNELAKRYGASKVATYYGETEAEHRQEIVEKFQSGEIKYFIGQPRTGGYGLTLTNAKTVIYFNNTYDMEVRLQSEDRAHRIGQKDKVTYIDIVCPKTIDEKIMETLNNKKKLADEITGDNWKELFSL
jgi:SNF2 family DNA or RNA helicase